MGTNLVGHYNRMKDRAWGDHWDEAIGEKMELNPHIPKPDPPKEEEKVEEKKEEAEDKKEHTRSHPARTLPRVSPRPSKSKKRKKKICTNSKALAHSTSFPMTSYLLDRSRSVMWTKRRMNYLTHNQCH